MLSAMETGTPYLIGIAGASCSGKTVLARRLAEALPGSAAFALDNYYRDLSALTPEARARWNFDVPEALDKDLLVAQLETLVRGEPIDVPEYDFTTHTRTARTTRMRPARVVLVEGIFALYWEEVRRLLDLKIFVDIDDAVCLQRRTERDIRERGRTEASVLAQYTETVRPMYAQYCAPTARFADLVLNGESPLEASAATVLARTEGQGAR